MTVSNSLYFTRPNVGVLPGIGWTVRVLDHNTYSQVVAIIASFVELSVGPELSAPGAASITFSAHDPFWATTLPGGDPATALKEAEYLWEAWQDGALRFQWFGRVVKESVDQNENEVVVISGPGIADYLSWAKVFPPGYPTPNVDKVKVDQAAAALATAQTNQRVAKKAYDTAYANYYSGTKTVAEYNALAAARVTLLTAEGKLLSARTAAEAAKSAQIHHNFANTPAMACYLKLLAEAQSRGVIPKVTPLFTATKDAGGIAWSDAAKPATWTAQYGTDMLAQLDALTGADLNQPVYVLLDWYMHPNFILDVRNTIGTNRVREVIFHDAGATASRDRTRLRNEVGTYVLVRDVVGKTSYAADATAIERWGRREVYQYRANLIDSGKRQTVADLVLQQLKDEQSSWTIKVAYDEPGRVPFVDYDIGDWIGVSIYRPGGTSEVESFRVMAIVVTVDANGQASVELTLQTKLEARLRRLADQINSLINQVTNTAVVTPTLPEIPLPPYPKAADPVIPDYPDPPVIPPSTYPAYGYASGIRVFIQDAEPSGANTGDIWVQTGIYTPPAPSLNDVEPPPVPLPDLPDVPWAGG